MSLFARPNKYFSDNFRKKSTLVDDYKRNMTEYLRITNPNSNVADIERFVTNEVESNFTDRTVKYIYQESEANIESKSGSLYKLIRSHKDDIITPYGSTFVPKTEDVTFFDGYIKEQQEARKIVKQKEIVAQASGDKSGESNARTGQMNIKIDINAITGIMKNNVFFSSEISYNSITSVARFSIMTAYSCTEAILSGNLHIDTENKAINWIIRLLDVYPGDDKIQLSVDKYKLYIPTVKDLESYIIGNLDIYSKFGRKKRVRALISNLSEYRRIFVYYAYNLMNIFGKNDQFKNFFNSILAPTGIEDIPVSEGSITNLPDSTLRVCTIVLLSDEIDIPIDRIDEERPDLAKKIKQYYSYLEVNFDRISNVIDTFILLPVVPSNIAKHTNMIRKTTVLSDTDSVIFSNVHWAKWFTGTTKLSSKSYDINAIMVFILSKILNYVFQYTSVCLNIATDELDHIDIKNEYMYPVFVRTAIGKHYAGYVMFREGSKLSPYKFDLKGRNFIGSDFCETTNTNVKSFIRYVLDTVLEHNELSVTDLLLRVIRIEQEIIASIRNGDTTYYGTMTIKPKAEYKTVSNYIYYELWEEVFAEKKGAIVLPHKFMKVNIAPLQPNNVKSLDCIKDTYPTEYDKLVKFMKTSSRKKLSAIYVPVGYEIPKALVEIADIRKITRSNCSGIYLFMRSLNIINSSTKNSDVLFSDEYTELKEAVIGESK